MTRILPKLAWAVAALLVLALAGVVTARVVFARYLHGEAFRQTLGESAANSLHASRANFSPLDFDGPLVYADNFRAAREDGRGFSSIDADQLRATFDWHGLLHHMVQIDEMAIQRVNIEPPVPGVAPAESNPGLTERMGSPVPLNGKWKVDLRRAVINETNWHWSGDPADGITGVALTLTPDEQRAWVIEAQGGIVRQRGWPPLDLERAAIRWQNPTLYINSSSLRNGAGRVTVTGSVETGQSLNLDVTLEGVDVQPLLTPDWRQRLTGSLNGSVNVQAPLGTAWPADSGRPIRVSGSASLANGQLTALPILDQIGAFTQTARFRQLELTRASADFTHTPDRLEVRNLAVESEGLIRVEGAYTVEHGEIAGTFQVGLTPATLQWIPGSQEQIFTVSRGGYLWTSVRLTGPAEHPVDDLTPRLVAATSKELIQGAEGTVEKAAQGALNLLLH